MSVAPEEFLGTYPSLKSTHINFPKCQLPHNKFPQQQFPPQQFPYAVKLNFFFQYYKFYLI